MDQPAVKGQANQPVTNTPSSTSSQLNFLLTNNNAWKMAAGLLMQEMAEVATKEVETNNLLHQAQAATVAAQADASKTMANATMGTSLADAGNNFISAGSSGGQAASGFSSINKRKNLMNDHAEKSTHLDNQIQEHKSQIDKHNATTSVGGLESHVNVPERQAKIKELEAKKQKLEKEHGGKEDEISKTHETNKALTELVGGFSRVSTSVGKGASDAAHTQANVVSSMDQQMLQAEQDAAKSAMEAANSAVSVMGQIGSISVAAVRG